jgi:hypothetical protein
MALQLGLMAAGLGVVALNKLLLNWRT